MSTDVLDLRHPKNLDCGPSTSHAATEAHRNGRQYGGTTDEEQDNEGHIGIGTAGAQSATEGQCKFDGTDYPSWLGFDPLKRPDEPYTFPFPAVDGDPWEKVSNMVKRHDDNMCDAWVEEIQNILIFAGLFSAVVTSFAVETQKLLQPDPGVTSVMLLTQIVGQLTPNASINATNSAFALHPPSNVSFQTIRINAFLFISLILALGTALVGILALQWIRSYKKQELRSHQDQLSVRQGRYQAFTDWKVPQIITALPIVLQIALVLFFIGLVDLLKSLDGLIATIVGVVVGTVLAIVLFTTVAPAFYVCFLHKAYSLSKPASIPPYCSPQSWLLYKLSMYINGLWYILRGRSWFKGAIVASWDEFLLRSVPNRPGGSFDHWLSPALGWVFRNLTTQDSFGAAYHCFQLLPKRDVAEEIVNDYLWSDHRLLHTLFPDFKKLEPSSYSAVLCLHVLQFHLRDRTAPRDLHLHSMELGLRAMACNTPRHDDEGNRLVIHFPTTFLLKLEPKMSTGPNILQEQNIWLYAFLLTLRLSCAHFPRSDNSLSRQFAVFWGIAISTHGTKVGEDSLHCLDDWIRSVPQGHCETDKTRLVACIVNLVTFLPLKSKAIPNASKFCQSTAFLRLLNSFVDHAKVHEVWLQTMINWPGSPAMLEHWDQFMISLQLDKKYWALGFAQDRLQHMHQELITTGQISMDLNMTVQNTPSPHRQSLLVSSHQRLSTIFSPSAHSSKSTLPFHAEQPSSVSLPQLQPVLDVTPEATSETVAQNRIYTHSITLSERANQSLHSRPCPPEETRFESHPDIPPDSITIVVDRHPVDTNAHTFHDSPARQSSVQLPDPEPDPPSIILPANPAYQAHTASDLDSIMRPTSPGPYHHFLDPITWAIEVPNVALEHSQEPRSTGTMAATTDAQKPTMDF